MPVCFQMKLNGNFRRIARAFYSHVKSHCVLNAHMWGPLWLFVMCILYNHVCFLLMTGVALFLCSSHISRKAPGPKTAAPCRIVILLSSLLFFPPTPSWCNCNCSWYHLSCVFWLLAHVVYSALICDGFPYGVGSFAERQKTRCCRLPWTTLLSSWTDVMPLAM